MTSEPAVGTSRARFVRRAGVAGGAALLAAGAWWWAVGHGPAAPAQPGAHGMAATSAGRAGPTMMPGLAPSAPHALGGPQVDAMVANLVARLQARPADAEGWAMLARTHMALSRHAEALAAYRRSIELRPDDATLLADYADALALNNGGRFEGEPLLLIERALRVDPDNAKALVLAGTAAFNRQDDVAAVRHWDRVVRTGPADGNLMQAAIRGAAQARARSQLPAAMPTVVRAMAAAASGVQSAAAPVVSGTVRMATRLAGQTSPEDTVFVFARPAEGSRMPLAILRKQVKDLPLDFRFEVSPTVAASRLVVVARISPTGQPTAQSGDLEGRSAAVAAGAIAGPVEINTRLP